MGYENLSRANFLESCVFLQLAEEKEIDDRCRLRECEIIPGAWIHPMK